jgi:hypothetical protein
MIVVFFLLLLKIIVFQKLALLLTCLLKDRIVKSEEIVLTQLGCHWLGIMAMRNCESASIVNTEAEESTVLGTVTKQGLLNTQQAEKA